MRGMEPKPMHNRGSDGRWFGSAAGQGWEGSSGVAAVPSSKLRELVIASLLGPASFRGLRIDINANGIGHVTWEERDTLSTIAYSVRFE